MVANGHGHRVRGLHGRHRHARGGLHQRRGRAGHRAHASTTSGSSSAARLSHHLHVRRRRGRPACGRARGAVHRQDLGVELLCVVLPNGQDPMEFLSSTGRTPCRRSSKGRGPAHGLRVLQAPGGLRPLGARPQRVAALDEMASAPRAARELHAAGRLRHAAGGRPWHGRCRDKARDSREAREGGRARGAGRAAARPPPGRGRLAPGRRHRHRTPRTPTCPRTTSRQTPTRTAASP
jgi:hypothetical protein